MTQYLHGIIIGLSHGILIGLYLARKNAKRPPAGNNPK
jgi:uncharacterized protein YneF (UPF0154 family)